MRRWLGGACALLLAGPAHALCSVIATTPANFGDVASTTLRLTSQNTSTVNAGLRCSGTLASVLGSGDHVYATITSTQTGLLGPTGDVINYTLYANNTGSYPITRGVQYDFARNGIIDALGLLTSPTPKNAPLYMGTVTGQNVAAGTYTETLTILWSWDYCSGINLLGLCLGRDTNLTGVSTTLTVSLRVTNDCQITTPTIAFGNAPVVAGFATVNQAVNVSCTKGSAYTVGMGDGQNVSGTRRRMKSAAGNFLAYDIFKSAGSVRWGSVGTAARRSSTDADVNPGLGTGTGSQIFNYNAKVYTDQATPPAGLYQDNVVLDVQF